MKIVLIHPPSDPLCHETVFGLKAPPLGLAYIASYLEERGFKPEIIDMSVCDMSTEEMRNRLERLSPNIVGVYCSITRVRQSLDIAKIGKSLGATIVFGGPHATANYETIIKNDNVDIIVLGEGEEKFARLAELIESRHSLADIRGIAFKDKGKIEITPIASLIPDLDELPFPAFHLLPMESYRICGNISIATLASSRGCSRNCRYCLVPKMYQSIWRGKSPVKVVDEMESIYSHYKPALLLFFDECFTEDLKRLEKITEEIHKRNLEIKWASMSTGIDISKELMIKMRKSGCLALFFGIDCGVISSASSPIKTMNIDIISQTFVNAHQAGLFPIANAVFGFPGETKTDFEYLLQRTIELDPDHALFFKAVPYSEFSDYELDQMEKEAYKSFYNRRSYILKHLARSVSRVVRFRNFSIDFMWKYSKWFFKTIRIVKSL